MTQLSFSFCMSMLHSLWQSGLLLLFYSVLSGTFLNNHSPLEKRNLLFILLGVQLFLFIITFIIYFNSGPAGDAVYNWGAIIYEKLPVKWITPWIFIVYCLVLTYKLLKAGYTWYHFTKQYRSGLEKAPVDLRLFTASKAYQFGIKKKVNIWLSNNIQTPLTFGFFKPVILFPVALLNNLSTRQAEALLVHELSHIKANDYLLNWFLQLIESFFFFNPFLAELGRKVRIEREKNCDLHVIHFNYPPSQYAEALLLAEQVRKMKPVFQLAAVNHKKQLIERIIFFSKNQNTRDRGRMILIAPLLGLLVILYTSSMLTFNSTRIPYRNTTPAVPTGNPASVRALHWDGRMLISNSSIADKNELFHDRVEEMAGTKLSLRKKILTVEPFVSNMQERTDRLMENISTQFAIPVNIRKNEASEQIIITEESSGSKSASVKVYRLDFENGKWLLKPEWMALAKEVRDSVIRNLDTTLGKWSLPQ